LSHRTEVHSTAPGPDLPGNRKFDFFRYLFNYCPVLFSANLIFFDNLGICHSGGRRLQSSPHQGLISGLDLPQHFKESGFFLAEVHLA
jgi:hypothetical protein